MHFISQIKKIITLLVMGQLIVVYVGRPLLLQLYFKLGDTTVSFSCQLLTHPAALIPSLLYGENC